jgi:hypothetical protein
MLYDGLTLKINNKGLSTLFTITVDNLYFML